MERRYLDIFSPDITNESVIRLHYNQNFGVIPNTIVKEFTIEIEEEKVCDIIDIIAIIFNHLLNQNHYLDFFISTIFIIAFPYLFTFVILNIRSRYNSSCLIFFGNFYCSIQILTLRRDIANFASVIIIAIFGYILQ